MTVADFVAFLEARAGEALRAVVWYEGFQDEILYLRDDLDVVEMERRIEEVQHNVNWQQLAPDSSRLESLGDVLSTIIVREGAIIIHLPVGENAGFVFGLSPNIARSLHEFVVTCKEQVADLDVPDGGVETTTKQSSERELVRRSRRLRARGGQAHDD